MWRITWKQVPGQRRRRDAGCGRSRFRNHLLAGTLAIAAGCGSGAGLGASHPSGTVGARALRIHAGPVAVVISARQRAALARGGTAAADRLLARLSLQRRARGTLRLRFAGSAAVTLERAASGTVARVHIAARVAAVQLALPAIRQRYRDDCEATALSMMLGGRVSQYRLQAMLPIASPLQPEQTAHGLVWGDPQRGFVGEVRGGGYGVYDMPLLALARRFDPQARNLSRHSLADLVAALRSGHPVVAWMQFGPSVPRDWTTPSGRTVRANFAEHAVTLTGWRPGWFTFNNPWTGTRQRVTMRRFAVLWHTLGDMAIEGSSVLAASQVSLE